MDPTYFLLFNFFFPFRVGFFPYMSMAGFAAFLPPLFWDSIVPKFSPFYERILKIFSRIFSKFIKEGKGARRGGKKKRRFVIVNFTSFFFALLIPFFLFFFVEKRTTIFQHFSFISIMDFLFFALPFLLVTWSMISHPLLSFLWFVSFSFPFIPLSYSSFFLLRSIPSVLINVG